MIETKLNRSWQNSRKTGFMSAPRSGNIRVGAVCSTMIRVMFIAANLLKVDLSLIASPNIIKQHTKLKAAIKITDPKISPALNKTLAI